MPRAITEGLRLRGIGVMTAQEDGARRLADPELLDRAAALSRVLFTRDADLLAEATQRQRTGRSFAGLVYAQSPRRPLLAPQAPLAALRWMRMLALIGDSFRWRDGFGLRGGAVNGAPHRAERPAHSRPGRLGHTLRTAS